VSSHDLVSFLRQVQEECGGAIPFERFMQEALYHPRFGYYSANIKDVGRGGDFSTSATLGEGLGAAIASWITGRSKELGWKDIPVIEIGAGNGVLAHSVLKHLPWRKRWRTDYMIHETSPILRERQKKILRWRGVRWIDSLPQTLDSLKGRALIFSNELVDAFPCRLYMRTETSWEELGVRILPDGSLSEVSLSSPSTLGGFASPDTLPLPSQALEGQRVERHDSYHSWMRAWAPHWKSGSMLTIDYGDVRERLYTRRPEGSLRAYWKHQRYTGRDLYARFGKQDLTADVNFSDLITWGEAWGWKTIHLTIQREFLTRFLLSAPNSSPSRGIGQTSSSTTINSNIDTEAVEDAGDAFKVLEQQPNSLGG
jgi:SAM-dependent MidA family methyltransferase